MHTQQKWPILDQGNGDEPETNFSKNPHFNEIAKDYLNRRDILKGGFGASLALLFGGSLTACGGGSSGTSTPTGTPPLLGFKAVPVYDGDQTLVPEGYRTQVLGAWGEPITGHRPVFDPMTNTGMDQAHQIGSHHDGMHFFPIEGQSPYAGSSTDGLLVLNHEYVEPRFMHASAVGRELSRDAVPLKADGKRLADEVLKELNGHGVSISRIRKQADGQWAMVPDSRNRRITGLTEMEISGPVRGSDFVRTRFSPNGTRTRGTLNNCAHGVTPWNTYLTCEENWAGYFVNRAVQPREQSRYGVASKDARYGWDLADNQADEFVRFDVTPKGSSAIDDYRNEANGFGWVVEIDPFNPESTPVKRSSLGRFAHEGVIFHKAVENKPIVCYSGDDANNQYIYKFVSERPYQRSTADGRLLDEGTLYVARFNADGTGQWLPLVFGEGPLVPAPVNQGDAAASAQGFVSQADVLINTRLAADLVGATKMDRPEWGAIDPKSGHVYFTLTNNTARTVTDPANPRANSRWGHIIRWHEEGGDPAAKTFHWAIFVLSGPENDSNLNGKPLDASNIHNSPDGLWFDDDGRLWIQTDTSESVMNRGDYALFGNNQMLAADPETKEMRRFFVGPLGQEITGVTKTPDGKTMFINVQHPGATTSATQFASGQLVGRWPHTALYPRSATVVITREDGGVVGT